MNEDLDATDGEVVTLFAASSCKVVTPIKRDHYVTDGPFMYRSKTGELFMIWSSFIKGQYAELLVRFKDGRLSTDFEHLPPIIDNDGGHGMIFSDDKHTYFTYHTPNTSGFEHPEFCVLEDCADGIKLKK